MSQSQNMNLHENNQNQGHVANSNTSSGAPQKNVISYQKQIKSNNQVFQQNQQVMRPQNGQPVKQMYSQQFQQSSPSKMPKKVNNQNSNQNFEYQHSKYTGNQPNQDSNARFSAGHRRSKTDGNAQNIMMQQQQMATSNGKMSQQQYQYNHENVLNLNLQHQLDKNQSQSRQQNINSNLNLGQKNSNQSAKSAQIQGVNNGKIGGIITAEQAAKNLKFVNNNQDNMMAATRNTNLTSNPKKDQQQQYAKAPVSNGQHNSYSYAVHNDAKKSMQKSNMVNNKQNKGATSQVIPQLAVGAQNNISIDQLQQLMKNPQIAQFLKEQIELQQQNDPTQQFQFQGVSRTMAQQKVGAAGQNSHVTQNSLNKQDQLLIQAAQGIPQPLRCSESNMNSDTSQEILRYQKEWAKQFHEHVNGLPGNQIQALNALQNQNMQNQEATAGVISGTGAPSQVIPTGGNSVLTGQDSSQMILNRPDDSQEQIALLPESAFTNNMQNLNANARDNAQINFYQQQNRLETEISTGNTQLTSALVYEKKGGGRQDESEPQTANFVAPPPKIPINQPGSRNIMNGGKQLSFMTVCSDIMDASADLDIKNLRDDSQESQKDEEDEYLTFQLCEGEEMNNEMANFIGIHMLNDGYLDGEEPQDKPDAEGGLTFQCPDTGSHFEFLDLVGRMRNLKQKRTIIDQAITAEDQRLETIKKQKAQQEQAKQKQLQKQRKLKTQVQNILKSAQQDTEGDQDNDSLPRQHNILNTESDLLILEDEDHLQSHHITTNVKSSNINLQNFQAQQQMGQNQGKNYSGQGKIYNTHDGRQKQTKLDDNASQHNQLRTANNMNIQSNLQNKQMQNNGSFKVAGGANNAMHQASSLASNHASKISHISKTYQQNPQQPNALHDKQQQMIMQLRQNSKGFDNKQAEKAYYQANRASAHQRGNSDDVGQQFTTMGLQADIQNQGGTMIHSNHLSSLVNSNNNNTFVNTALGSSRGKQNSNEPNIKSSLHNRNSKKQVNQNGQSTMVQQKMNKTGINVGQQNQFKQTAQFGPQMNLIKSQLPHQNNGNNMTQKQSQQKQIKSVEMRSKQYLSSVSGGASTVNQNQQQQILTSNSTNSNQQRAMIMQNNGIQAQDKRQQNLKNKIVNASMNQKALRQQSVKSGPGGITSNSIYQNQLHQRKSKLINTGGNMMGYDMSKGNVTGQVQNQQQNSQAGYFQNQGGQNHYNTTNTGQTQNSIGREQQTHLASQNSQINSIPNSNQIHNASKMYNEQSYQHQTNSTGGSIPSTKAMGPTLKQQNVGGNQIQGQHIQSYSFDYRQQQQSKLQPAIQKGSVSNQQRISNQANNFNGGGQMGANNLRTFDGQYSQQKNTTNTSQSPPNMYMMQSRQTQGSNMGTHKAQPVSSNQPKNKSSSLGQPKDGQLNSQQSRFNQEDYDYHGKGMNKKVKSTQNNQIYSKQNDSSQKVNKIKENEQINVRNSYNSTGPSMKNKLDNSKYQPSQGGGFMNVNHNINSFDNQMNANNEQSLTPAEFTGKTQKVPSKSNSKRITAVTRGVQSGTNARVNTFDNRGMQAQNQQNMVQQNTGNQAPHTVLNTNNPKIYELQQPMRQPSYNGQSDKPSQGHSKNRASYSGSQPQYSVQQQQQMMNNYGQQPQKPGGKLSSQNSNSQQQNQQQKSPKRNIYLLNYQGNVQII